MNVEINWQGKRKFDAVGNSGHHATMDVKKEAGGDGSAPSPMEMVLMGLGGCSAYDVVTILEKMRLNIEEFKMELNGTRAEEMPQRYTDIHIHYILKGAELTPDKVERAIVLSRDKYCSATASLNAEFRMTFELNGTAHEVGGSLTDED
ncbi:MAG: OsmC family protein [Tumebacillaceae bacterium]